MQAADDPDARFKRFERGAWGERAATYDDVTGQVTASVVGPLLDAAGVRVEARVLDVGCGPGTVTAAAASRGARAVGVDLAEGMLAAARERHPDLEFLAGDAEALPFEDAAFDAVVANFLLNHVPVPDRAAKELARVVAPGGRVAVTVWDRPERNRLFGEVTDAVADAGLDARGSLPSGPDPYRFADDGEMRAMLAGAGLEAATAETLDLTHRADSVDGLWSGLLGGSARVSTVIAGQTPEVQARIRAAFVRRISRWMAGDGVEVPAVVKLGAARRP